jgi:hypothetical protein
MTRRERDELNRKLARFYKRALEPSGAFELERLAELIEELEFQLLAQRLAA